MKPLHENLIVQVDQSRAFYNQLHQHTEIQLSFIIKGTGKLIVGDSIHHFTDGDFFAIGSNSPHLFKSEKSQTNVQMISLFFTKETFGADFFKLSDLEESQSFFEEVKDGFQILSRKNEVRLLMVQFSSATKLTRVILFLQLLMLLNQTDKKPLTNFVYPKETGLLAGERLQVVFDFVLRHFQEEIKLDAISNLVHMTPNAFCKFFKQRTNKTFFQFLIELRIEHACQLLQRNRDVSIAEISEVSGFKSISNFNRQFKAQKGSIPSSYRKAE
ncbi:MAG: AraC family transcriptional regulator [Maribacter sp.]